MESSRKSEKSPMFPFNRYKSHQCSLSIDILFVTYKIGYSLSNNHHNMTSLENSRISIDGIFKEIGKVSNVPFQKTKPLQNVWAINLTRKPLLGQEPRISIKQGSSSREVPIAYSFDYDPLRERAIARTTLTFEGLPPSNNLRQIS
uniref:Uncharacterized protein n=1 Tax=Salix viminalis TaxID=40686 RepID=A0A6N2LKQ1_SALVM